MFVKLTMLPSILLSFCYYTLQRLKNCAWFSMRVKVKHNFVIVCVRRRNIAVESFKTSISSLPTFKRSVNNARSVPEQVITEFWPLWGMCQQLPIAMTSAANKYPQSSWPLATMLHEWVVWNIARLVDCDSRYQEARIIHSDAGRPGIDNLLRSACLDNRWQAKTTWMKNFRPAISLGHCFRWTFGVSVHL